MVLGKTNQLYINRLTDFGFFLVDEEENEVLLPNAFITDEMAIDDVVEVFVYRDSLQRLVATTEVPIAEVDNFVYIQAKVVNETGAFFDWGVSKDLLVPYAEQPFPIEEGNYYLIFIFIDEETDRIIGSAREDDFLFFDNLDVNVGDEVDLLFYKQSHLGWNAIVNNMYKGLLFADDIHQEINAGDKKKGYVKKIREDGKIDLSMTPTGYRNKIDDITSLILSHMKDGKLNLTDKSKAESINAILGISKSDFKKGVGKLYKERKITIQEDFIQLSN